MSTSSAWKESGKLMTTTPVSSGILGAVLILAAAWILYLALEAALLRRARGKLRHVVHVNGTRGKSSVSRMIAAGLSAGGIRTFCKTTGTDPMTIDTAGHEALIKRRGPANIREQIRILRQAAAEGAEVFVVECMAVDPALQRAAQHMILRADIGVITNVRRDHTDVMGDTLPEIAEALCSTVPDGGILFTAEKEQLPILQGACDASGTKLVCAEPDEALPTFDFPDNIALSLAVCSHLGVPRDKALEGMKNYLRDPYVLSVRKRGCMLFVNAFSANDIQSVRMIHDMMLSREIFAGGEWILVINNRPDRGSRTEDMLTFCRTVQPIPEKIFLLGAARGYMERGIRRSLAHTQVRAFGDAKTLCEALGEEERGCADRGKTLCVFATGNIAGCAREVLQLIGTEGESIV